MIQTSFLEAVERIRELDASEGMTAFEMGDVVLSQVPMGDSHAHNNSEVLLRRLAEESGVDYNVLDDRRKVSAAIPQGVRTPSVAWSVYRQIALYAPEAQRQQLLKLVNTKPPTQLVDGTWRTPKQKRWTVDAIRTHFGEKSANPAQGSAALLTRAFREAPAEAIDAVLE